MTFIDAHPHDNLGELLGIEVYRLHHGVHEAYELTAGPDDLVLGHGSGGWPAAPIPIDLAVVEYLGTLWDEAGKVESGDDAARIGRWAMGDVTAEQIDAVYTSVLEHAGGHEQTIDTRLVFQNWGGNAWAQVVADAKAAQFGVRYEPDVHGSIEGFLIEALGEFALITGLYSSLMAERGTDVDVDAVRQVAIAANLYRNVAQLPTGYRA